ncbi:GAP family protein [Mycobacterium yunnanensis]|uniref:GAP family protein n=1 Tax=Mycobacterium yunnanensis TaxID=368477 RepID=A0A9X2YS94_9MYCO|nr:GAP family protein [Mycobacterium yunnanensis]MCV7424662.1 GAP family protein [Mycobacterium yunnanensis]
MWITLLVMAVAIGLEPFRIGMAVVMLNRPRPLLQLLVFLCGGFVMGTTVGVIVLFVLRQRLVDSTHFTLPKVQLAIGALALLAALYLTVRPAATRPPGQGHPTWMTRLGTWVTRSGSPWVSAVAGLAIALPSVDFLAVLAVILASGAGAGTQVVALMLFQVVAFMLVEIPLVAYLVAPRWTVAAMTKLNAWVRSRQRREVAATLGVVGAVLVTVGLVNV